MAELKSTIELVMERTKHLVQSDEEKAETKKKERQARIDGIVLGLVEGRVRPAEVTEKMDEYAAGEPDLFRAELIRSLLGGIGLDHDNEQLFDTLDQLRSGQFRELAGRTAALIEEFRAREEEAKSAGAGGAIAELAAAGISGSALVAKEEEQAGEPGNPEDVRAKYQARLDDLVQAATAEL